MKFLHLNNLKKITKNLNEEASRVWENRIFISHEYFNQIHAVSSGRNSSSSLVDFQKKCIEAKSILLTREFQNSLKIYAYSDISEGQGATKKHLYLEYKKNGKKESLDYIDMHNIDRVLTIPDFSENNLEFISEEAKWGHEQKQKEKYIEKLLATYRFSIRDFIEEIQNDGKVEVIKAYVYTHSFSLYQPEVEETRGELILKHKNTRTYNTLPEIVSIEVRESLDTILLSKMGVEEKGYYDHTDKFEILADQEDEVMEFMSRFNKKIKTKKAA